VVEKKWMKRVDKMNKKKLKKVGSMIDAKEPSQSKKLVGKSKKDLIEDRKLILHIDQN